MPYNPTLPTWTNLNDADFTSSTGQTDLRTGLPLQGGNLVLGDYFDLREAEANQLSDSDVGTLHAGRYRFVKVDSTATAANVKTGTVGLMSTLAQGVNVVTSFDKGLGPGLHQVIFLNSITPGNYGFVQELGDASILMGGTGSGAAGTAVYATTGGVGTSTAGSDKQIGIAEEALGTSALKRILMTTPVIQD